MGRQGIKVKHNSQPAHKGNTDVSPKQVCTSYKGKQARYGRRKGNLEHSCCMMETNTIEKIIRIKTMFA